MSGLDDIKNKVTEKASDAGIGKAGDAADARTGGQHADKIDKAQTALDGKVGDNRS